MTAYEATLEKVVGIGSRIDLRLAIIRIGFFHADFDLISKNIEKATKYVVWRPSYLSEYDLIMLPFDRLADDGGDWDRRNRLKAYTGLYNLSIRNFKAGAELLLDTLSTFAATELMTYEEFITLCVISGVLTLERKDYKQKVSEFTKSSPLWLILGADHQLARSSWCHPSVTSPSGFFDLTLQLRIC